LVLAPDEQLANEKQQFGRSEKPQAILDIGLHSLEYEEIDLFNWHEAVARYDQRAGPGPETLQQLRAR